MTPTDPETPRLLGFGQTHRLLSIGDDAPFHVALERAVKVVSWELITRAREIAPERLVAMKLRAVLIDPALLDSDTSDYVARVSEALPDVALIVCAAPSRTADRVKALRAGADSWVTKPVHAVEAMARAEAAVRGPRQPAPVRDPIQIGELEIRPDTFQVFVSGRLVRLSRREFELLQLLASEAGRVFEREEIYRRVWGYKLPPGDRSVDVFVRKLRVKLDPGIRGCIRTHYGIGYRFDSGQLQSPEVGLALGRDPGTAAVAL